MKLSSAAWLSAITCISLLVQGSIAEKDIHTNLVAVGDKTANPPMGTPGTAKNDPKYVVARFCPGKNTKPNQGCVLVDNVMDDKCYLIPNSDKLGAKDASFVVDSGNRNRYCLYTDSTDCIPSRTYPALRILSGEDHTWVDPSRIRRSFLCKPSRT